MKKGHVRILALSILALFLVSFLIGVVNAADDAQTISSSLISKIQEILTNLFSTNSTGYDYFKNIFSPEVLFGVLIFLLIFAIFSSIDLFSNKWVSIPLSIVVAVLAAGFIPSQWFLPLLNQYTAIGILLSLAFPFVLIFLFLRKIAPYNGLVHKLVFSIFFIITLVNAVINWSSLTDKFSQLIYVLLLILNAAMFGWSINIFRAIWKEEVKNASENYNSILSLINANRLAEAKDALSRLGPVLRESQKTVLERYIKAAEKRRI